MRIEITTRRVSALHWFAVFLVSCGFAIPGIAADGAARLRYSGILGQSQPPGSTPAAFTLAAGIAAGPEGRLWTCRGRTLYRFDRGPDGKYTLGHTADLPHPVVHYLGLLPDGSGRRAFFAAYDGNVYHLNLSTGAVTPFCPARNAEGQYLRFGVAPESAAGSFAARAKLVQIDGDRVLGFDAGGEPLGVLRTLPAPPGGEGAGFGAVGFEPRSGDLLAASAHPDNRVYRFSPVSEVTTQGWPRRASGGSGGRILTVDGTAWIVGGTVQELPARMTEEALAAPRSETLSQVSGLVAAPDGGFWAATTQGLVQLDRFARFTGRRLGGLTHLTHLALGRDGALVGALRDGRMIRLGLDDAPDAPLRNENTPAWRVGQGYTGRAAGLCWDGRLFLVADSVGERLWHFDPWHTAWKEIPWIALAPEGHYPAPRAVAVGDMRWWLLAEQGLWEGSLAAADEGRLCAAMDALLPDGAHALAAEDDTRLYAAGARAIACLDVSTPLSPRVIWKREVRATDIAATREALFVSHADTGAVAAWHPDDGRVMARCTRSDIPGGWTPGVLAVRDGWVVVYDRAGSRVVRLAWEHGPHGGPHAPAPRGRR
jgi:hypothetical protein